MSFFYFQKNVILFIEKIKLIYFELVVVYCTHCKYPMITILGATFFDFNKTLSKSVFILGIHDSFIC